MIDSSNIELFNNKQLINLDEEFIRCLYHAFTSISYNFKINFTSIKNDEYIEKICDFINNNEELKNIIQNNKKDIKIEEKITMILFIDYNFDDNDVDLISV